MAAIVRTVKHLCPCIKDRLLEGAPVVLRTVTKEAAQKILSCLIGAKTVYAVRITFPYLSAKKTGGVVSKILKGDIQGVVQSVRDSKKNLMDSAIFYLNRSPKDLVGMIAGDSLQNMSLEQACSVLTDLSAKNVGRLICIAVVPFVSPFTVRGFIAYAISAFQFKEIVIKKEDIVELDDLKTEAVKLDSSPEVREDWFDDGAEHKEEAESVEFDPLALEDALNTRIDS